MSFKFGTDIVITFEMPGIAYSKPVDKIHISLQFRPSVIRGPWPNKQLEPMFNLSCTHVNAFGLFFISGFSYKTLFHAT